MMHASAFVIFLVLAFVIWHDKAPTSTPRDTRPYPPRDLNDPNEFCPRSMGIREWTQWCKDNGKI